jgi:hypothetical protein
MKKTPKRNMSLKIENFIGRSPHGVIYNSRRCPEALLSYYKKTKSNFVKPAAEFSPKLHPELSPQFYIDKKFRNDYTLYESELLKRIILNS